MRISRAHAAIFAVGFFGLGFVPMMTVAVPLWALDIGATPLMIGLVLGARAALSVVLSIPGGALMDRLGINRIAAAAAIATAVLFPLYPALPSVAVLIVLQLLTGFAQALVWMAAQAHMGRINRDDPGLMGRFSFVSTSGNLVAPVLCGTAWDVFRTRRRVLGHRRLGDRHPPRDRVPAEGCAARRARYARILARRLP